MMCSLPSIVRLPTTEDRTQHYLTLGLRPVCINFVYYLFYSVGLVPCRHADSKMVWKCAIALVRRRRRRRRQRHWQCPCISMITTNNVIASPTLCRAGCSHQCYSHLPYVVSIYNLIQCFLLYDVESSQTWNRTYWVRTPKVTNRRYSEKENYGIEMHCIDCRKWLFDRREMHPNISELAKSDRYLVKCIDRTLRSHQDRFAPCC